MKCPYLVGKYMYSCSALKEVYIPSAFESGEYCGSTRYETFKACPRYLEKTKGAQPQNQVDRRSAIASVR